MYKGLESANSVNLRGLAYRGAAAPGGGYKGCYQPEGGLVATWALRVRPTGSLCAGVAPGFVAGRIRNNRSRLSA